ncbi:MAG: hypothetical protein MJ151_03665, partial [Lachnospiraceae bacterium]|nr:hypothetical protein [Lachnospiraceae bacterium]
MEYLLFLQNVRENMNPTFNYFMNAVSDFVTNIGMLFLLFVVSYIFDKKIGRRMCFAYGFNIFMSIWAKNVACISRPWIRDIRIIPAKSMMETAGGFSFPSGHAT